MVISKLIGGLGNQMFQYATGRAVALRNNQEFKIDISGFDFQNKLDTPRSYELDIFKIKSEFATHEEINKLKQKNGSFIEKIVKNRAPFVSKFIFPNRKSYYYENIHQKFEEKILNIKGEAYLEGWWQSERYFKDNEVAIRKDFSFKNKLNQKYSKPALIMRHTNSVFLHVRLEDYINTYKSYFAQSNPAYYVKAINFIKQKVNKPHVFVFCGDNDWVRKNIKIDLPVDYVVTSTSKSDWQDYFQLMINCQHGITTNSTWSWWVAWLNNNPKKVIVAPKKWFHDEKINTQDRIPKDWLVI